MNPHGDRKSIKPPTRRFSSSLEDALRINPLIADGIKSANKNTHELCPLTIGLSVMITLKRIPYPFLLSIAMMLCTTD